MNKLIQELLKKVLFSIKVSFILMMILIPMQLFWEGFKMLHEVTIKDLIINYVSLFITAFVYAILALPPRFSLFGSIDTIVEPIYVIRKQKFSSFTKVIILFPGLPLISLLLSTPIVRLFEILQLGVEQNTIMIISTLIFWVYGYYLCKIKLFRSK